MLNYFCDEKRHLICTPYSIENLHRMAKDLGIRRYWFHKNHYDIPKRRIKEITDKCTVVSSKSIVTMIHLGNGIIRVEEVRALSEESLRFFGSAKTLIDLPSEYTMLALYPFQMKKFDILSDNMSKEAKELTDKIVNELVEKRYKNKNYE